MLRYNNPEDKEKMMRYHRTKDMINLLNYFPEISPIRNLTIVESIEDYKKHYEFLKDLPGERNDSLITKPFMKSIEGTGIKPDIPSILKKVKEIDKEGVIALFDLCHKPSERYERYAGISLGVSLRKEYILMLWEKALMEEKSQKVCLVTNAILFHGLN